MLARSLPRLWSRVTRGAAAAVLAVTAAAGEGHAQPAPAPPPGAPPEAAEDLVEEIDDANRALEERASEALANEAERQSGEVTGFERPPEAPGDTARDVGSALLFLPRQAVDFLFWSTSVAVGVIENEQVVPRAQQYVSASGGRIAVLPTAFVETGRPLNFGARMIADTGYAATSVRVGFGGIDSLVIEPRIAFQVIAPVRSVVSIEMLYERDTDLDYRGIGQEPSTDPRNQFVNGKQGAEARYFERKVRSIFGYAARLTDDLELVASTSLTRRQVKDIDDPNTMSAVFEAGSVPGAFEETWLLYTELAARVDTRPTRGRPSPGLRYEMYGGSSREAERREVSFLRVGGRLAAFVPVARPTNIISSQIALDTVKPLSNLAVPFSELPAQPDFRGLDNRRDFVSVVGSVDYRWLLAESFAARLFFDTALVAPELLELDPPETRWAAGVGFDLHSEEHEIGRLALSVSPEGLRFLLAIGVSKGYGDRQHRD